MKRQERNKGKGTGRLTVGSHELDVELAVLVVLKSGKETVQVPPEDGREVSIRRSRDSSGDGLDGGKELGGKRNSVETDLLCELSDCQLMVGEGVRVDKDDSERAETIGVEFLELGSERNEVWLLEDLDSLARETLDDPLLAVVAAQDRTVLRELDSVIRGERVRRVADKGDSLFDSDDLLVQVGRSTDVEGEDVGP